MGGTAHKRARGGARTHAHKHASSNLTCMIRTIVHLAFSHRVLIENENTVNAVPDCTAVWYVSLTQEVYGLMLAAAALTHVPLSPISILDSTLRRSVYTLFEEM